MKKQIRFVKYIISFLLAAAIMIPAADIVTAEELMAAVDFDVLVDGSAVYGYVPVPKERLDKETAETEEPTEETQEETVEKRMTLGAYTNGYDNKMYVSLRDLAVLLKGTASQFQFEMDFEQDSYSITTGQAYEAQEPVMVDMEPETLEGDYYDRDGNLRNKDDQIAFYKDDLSEPASRPQYEYLELYLNPLMINGAEVRYYTYQLSIMRDIYMDIIDVQLMLGITIEKSGDGSLNIYTDRGFDINLDEYVQDGYFDLYNGVLLGDASTGEILFGFKEENVDAIASTSKLMTYMVAARYLELGRISMDDLVTLSQNVENLSYSGNGTLLMDAGWQITVRDLIAATLINSSNESALALAEYIAGSEAEFVKLMNEMARVLELDSAKFCNSNGLPVYSDSLIASKRQNMMNVKDLFRLVEVILRKYPQVTEFTSSKSMYLPTFDFTVWNTSYLLYNMDNAIGLKTGTTDEAGCCLVGAVNAPTSDGDHVLTAIIIGAENNIDRYQVPEVLLTWGMNQLKNTAQSPKS